MRLNKQEIQVIRALAQEYMQLALMPRQEETKKLWYSINDGTMQRPMVLIDQVCWEEMDVDGSLKCVVKDPWWRGVEYQLRRDIYQAKHMPVDRVFEPIMEKQDSSGLLTRLFGEGKGSGAALLHFVLAFCGIGVCLYFRRNRAIWKLEE